MFHNMLVLNDYSAFTPHMLNLSVAEHCIIIIIIIIIIITPSLWSTGQLSDY